jgi:precorrin-6B methylase 1
VAPSAEISAIMALMYTRRSCNPMTTASSPSSLTSQLESGVDVDDTERHALVRHALQPRVPHHLRKTFRLRETLDALDEVVICVPTRPHPANAHRTLTMTHRASVCLSVCLSV